MNFVLNNCPALKKLFVRRLRGITDGAAAEPIGPGGAAASLKIICLKELYNGQCFGPLIIGANILRTLGLYVLHFAKHVLGHLCFQKKLYYFLIYFLHFQYTFLHLQYTFLHFQYNILYYLLKTRFNMQSIQALKLFRCSGDWDKFLGVIEDRVIGLVKVHLERLQVSDAELIAISNCLNLEILHLVKTPECTNDGLKVVTEHCKLLRKLDMDGKLIG